MRDQSSATFTFTLQFYWIVTMTLDYDVLLALSGVMLGGLVALLVVFLGHAFSMRRLAGNITELLSISRQPPRQPLRVSSAVEAQPGERIIRMPSRKSLEHSHSDFGSFFAVDSPSKPSADEIEMQKWNHGYQEQDRGIL